MKAARGTPKAGQATPQQAANGEAEGSAPPARQAPLTTAERQRRYRVRRRAELEALRQAHAAAKAEDTGRALLSRWDAQQRMGVVERELQERARTIKALRAERDAINAQLQALRSAVASGLAQLPPGARQAVQRAIAKAGGDLQ
jgi:hypothetical protein